MTQVAVRPVQDADVEVFYEQQADPVASQMAAFPSRDRAAHFDHWINRVLVNRDYIRTVIADGAVAGNIVSWVDPESGHRLFGYWLGRDFWGRGVATEAVRQYLDEITERPIYADVAVHNIGSQRVLEKNNFVRLSDAPTVESDGVELLLYRLD